MDDEWDFFTSRAGPSKPKPRSKAKSSAQSAEPSSSASRSSSSKAKPRLGGSSYVDNDGNDDAMSDIPEDEDDDEAENFLQSSDLDIASDDSNASAKRRVKRRRKNNSSLPAWASQPAYRRPSQEPSSSTAHSSSFDVDAAVAELVQINGGASTSKANSNKANGGDRRERETSLTPPPPVSPEKLSMARDLVSKVISSKFASVSSSASAFPPSTSSAATANHATSTAAGRATRSSATPGPSTSSSSNNPSFTSALNGNSNVIDPDEDDPQIHWDPDLARLMRGDNAKHIREQAKREQKERDERRKQRELERIRGQPSSNPTGTSSPSGRQGGLARTTSAPQTTRLDDGGEDSDDSVEFVPRPVSATANTNGAAQRRTTRSSTAAAATASQTTSAPTRSAAPATGVIEIEDSDDEPPPSRPARRSSSPTTAATADEADGDAGGATLDLTLSSKLGPLSVTVTPSTRLSTIISHFHSKKLATTADGVKVKVKDIKVSFDGEFFKPTQTVGEMEDVEDGDQVELSW